MRNRLPPLNPLRAFEATARYLSVSRAANELHVTPGAVSHQIRALEDELKVKLFDRTGGHLRLSSYGSALQPSVAAAFDSIAEAAARLTRSKTEGELVVSCEQALASFWLIPHLSSFAQLYPGVHLKLHASNDDRDVDSTDVDLCIRYGNGPWPNRHVQLWTHLVIFPVCSPTLVNERPLRTVEDLAFHTMLHGDDGREWQSWLSAAKAPPMMTDAHHFSITSNWHVALEAATYGHGIALGDNITINRLLEEGRLIMPFDLKIPAPASFYTICRTEMRNTPIVSAFTDWLASEIAAEKDKRFTDVETRLAV
jgi:LysR family glycine cleavage system transcriptional activator